MASMQDSGVVEGEHLPVHGAPGAHCGVSRAGPEPMGGQTRLCGHVGERVGRRVSRSGRLGVSATSGRSWACGCSGCPGSREFPDPGSPRRVRS